MYFLTKYLVEYNETLYAIHVTNTRVQVIYAISIRAGNAPIVTEHSFTRLYVGAGDI